MYDNKKEFITITVFILYKFSVYIQIWYSNLLNTYLMFKVLKHFDSSCEI